MGRASFTVSRQYSYTISLTPLKIPKEKYETVVIGSGFGGTILSLTLGHKYKDDNDGKKVCILERGQ